MISEMISCRVGLIILPTERGLIISHQKGSDYLTHQKGSDYLTHQKGSDYLTHQRSEDHVKIASVTEREADASCDLNCAQSAVAPLPSATLLPCAVLNSKFKGLIMVIWNENLRLSITCVIKLGNFFH